MSKDAQCKAQNNKTEENKREKNIIIFLGWGVGGEKCINNYSLPPPHPNHYP